MLHQVWGDLVSDLYEDNYEYADELAAPDWPVPFTQVPIWLLLSGCTAQAYRMYTFLAAHIQSGQRKSGERIVCPKQTAIAHVMGLKNPRQVGDYGRELERLGALEIKEYRYASEMRRGYRYVMRFSPPEGFAGPLSLSDFYGEHKGLKFAPTPGRVRAAIEPPADGGTENSTSGGAKNSTSGGAEIRTTGGTENSTSRGTTDGTSRGTTSGTTHGPMDGTTHGALSSRAHGATDGRVRESKNSTAEVEVEERDVEERENPPPPPPVRTAEDARADKQKGPASPDDLSPETAGGAAGAWPTVAPVGVQSAPTTQAVDRMAADVVRTLPRVLQPATDDERGAIHWLIADKLSDGYPVGVVRQVLNTDPPDHVKVKAAFIGHRLDHMAPWVPPQRPEAERATLDEINAGRALQGPDDDARQRARAAEARARMAAANERRRTQGESGGEA